MDPCPPMANTENPKCQDDLEGPMRKERGQSTTSVEPTETILHSPTALTKYYSVMDDQCPEEVFTSPPSPPSRLEPEEGSICEATTTDPSVSLRSSDGAEANTNPRCLDWHHGEKTSHNQVNEKRMESAFPTDEEVVSSSEIQGTRRDQEEQEDRFKIQGVVLERYDDGQPEDQILDNEDSENTNGHFTDDTGLKIYTQNTNTSELRSDTEDLQITMEAATSTKRSNNAQEDSTDGNTENALDKERTGYDWVKRTDDEDDEDDLLSEPKALGEKDDGCSETISDSRLATEIMQGENLLHRLQLVQQRQDLDGIYLQTPKQENIIMKTNVLPETIQAHKEHSDEEAHNLLTVTAGSEDCSIHQTEAFSSNKEMDTIHCVDVTETRTYDVCKHFGKDELTKEFSLTDSCQRATGAVDEELTNKKEDKKCTNNEDDEQEEKERASFPTLSPQESDDRGTDHIDGTETSVNSIPLPPCHRFSAAETFMEKQFQDSSQTTRDLQRAEGVFDLTENPDILEIPFKTKISLELLSTSEDPCPTEERHFSGQKMKREISHELQRELVLVNMGKIPGGYSKGESRHMKDTKLLFEAFQQEKVEGPTRIRKPQTSLPKSPVYPSVLERTRSLEMLSQKVSPILRTHSFRLVSNSEKEKYPETLRPLSPSIRDKGRLSPYPKHEKHARMHKSLDSINTNSPTSTRGRSSNQEPHREGSPLLKDNPFFKLRPALSLQPEVERDIREAKRREEELRKQRSSLYGEKRQGSREETRATAVLKADSTLKTTGRLERVWPPPPKKEPTKAEQQEAKVQRGLGHRAALWQQWESGCINGQSPANNNN